MNLLLCFSNLTAKKPIYADGETTLTNKLLSSLPWLSKFFYFLNHTHDTQCEIRKRVPVRAKVKRYLYIADQGLLN